MSARKLYDVWKDNVLIAESVGIEEVERITGRRHSTIFKLAESGSSVNGFVIESVDDIATLKLCRDLLKVCRAIESKKHKVVFTVCQEGKKE